jgi:glycosyltransferase involved in cell wall biosynthesis
MDNQGIKINRDGYLKVKILHVIINSQGGGAEKTVQELHIQLLMLGIESKIACIDPMGDQVLSNHSSEIVLNPGKKSGIGRILISVLALNRLLKEYKPDILQLNCEAPELVVSLSRWKRYCKHLVITEHSSTPWTHAPNLGLFVRRYSSLRNARFTSCAAFNSSRYFDSAQNVVIPNLLRSIDLLPKIAYTQKISGIFIAQRLFPVKRLVNLFEILGKIRTDLPVVVCGDGPEFSALHESATKNGIHVDFKGNIPNPWIFYEEGYLYISCSEREGNPLSVAEAVLCRAPMLLSRIETHLFAVSREIQTFSSFDDLESKLRSLFQGNISLDEFRNEQEFTDKFISEYSNSHIMSLWKSFYASL